MIIASLQSTNPYARRKNATCGCLIATASFQTTEAEHIQTQLEKQGYLYIEPQDFELAKARNKPVFTRAFYIRQSKTENAIYCDFILFHPEKHPKCLIIDHSIHFHMDEFGMNNKDERNYDEFCEGFADFDQYEEDHDDDGLEVWIRNICESYLSPTVLVPDDGYYQNHPQDMLGFTSSELHQRNIQHIFSMPEFSEWAANGGI